MSDQSQPAMITPDQPAPQNSLKLPTNSFSPSDKSLSQQQLMAIEAILMGYSQSNAAKHAGVDRKTLYNWRHDDENFVRELQLRQELIYQASIDRIRASIPHAVSILCAELEADCGPRQVRASTAILALANMRSLIPIKSAGA
jgi:DNA-binding XRE family transcriptional regulator